MSFINMNKRLQLVEKLKVIVCDGLAESDTICEKCNETLKTMTAYAIIGEPAIYDQGIDRKLEGNVTLHASCAARLLTMFEEYIAKSFQNR